MHTLIGNSIKEGKAVDIMKICPNRLFNSGLLNAYPSLESILSSHIQGEHTLDLGEFTEIDCE